MFRCLLLLLPLALPGCASTGALSLSGDPSDDSAQPIGEPAPSPPASPPTGEELSPVAPDQLPVYDSRSIPGGLACLIRLRQADIPYRSFPSKKGVLTPVQATGPIGGVRYLPLDGKTPLLADCRLLLALDRAGPYLRRLGVSEVYYSGAYSYRLMPSGRLSQHAMGLAIDVHRLRAHGELLEVRHDFALGLEDGCAPGGPLLNRLACLLKSRRVFDWVLTPDFDAAHHNHLHLDIYCLHRRRFKPRGAPELAVDD